VPVGVLHGIKSIIGPGCVVNISKLLEEISELNSVGIDVKNLLFIDKRAHVITDTHLADDAKDNRIGTTKQGIGPAYRDKYDRVGTRIGTIETLDQVLFSIIDIYDLFFSDKEYYKILCEGAQGFNLDIDWGDYPYVTSSHCTVGSVCLNGIPPHKIRKVFGVIKAYETYVGNKTTFTDENDPTFKRIQTVGNEFGATTGRPRKVNWLNLDSVIPAMQINGVTDLIINKMDVLDEVESFGVIHDNFVRRFTASDKLIQFVDGVLHEQSYRHLRIIWSKTPHGI
jgi:adenylosuccinate synthase